MTTYERIHGNMEYPICGKTLIEHELSDSVACKDVNRRFNEEIDIFKCLKNILINGCKESGIK